MSMTARTVTEHTNALAAYLRNGRTFEAKNRGDSNFRQLLEGLAGELKRVHDDFVTLEKNYQPDIAGLYLSEWESAVGIPDDCFTGTGTNDERLQDISIKIVSMAVQTVEDFENLAAALGITITSVEPDPDTKFGILVSHEINIENVFPMTFPFIFGSGDLALLECAFNRVKPANCVVNFIRAGTWSQSGSGLGVVGAGSPALAALDSSTVAFVDSVNDQLRTYSWSGSAWSLSGSALSISPIGNPALAALDSSTVAFVDQTNGELRTYSWSGSAWSQTGSGLSIGPVANPALAALDSSTVAFIDQTNDELRTYSWSGSVWSQIGSSLGVPATGAPALAALDSSTVAFIDSTNEQLRTYEWTPI